MLGTQNEHHIAAGLQQAQLADQFALVQFGRRHVHQATAQGHRQLGRQRPFEHITRQGPFTLRRLAGCGQAFGQCTDAGAGAGAVQAQRALPVRQADARSAQNGGPAAGEPEQPIELGRCW